MEGARLCGYAGVRVGEASHPGPTLTIGSYNVTSLLKHAEYVENLAGVDILALQEVRLTSDALPIAADALGSWGAVWGKAQPQRREGPSYRLDAKPGGVGILNKQNHTSVPTPRTRQGDLLSASGRWQSVTVKVGAGAFVLHIVVVYGHTRANEGGKPCRKMRPFSDRS